MSRCFSGQDLHVLVFLDMYSELLWGIQISGTCKKPEFLTQLPIPSSFPTDPVVLASAALFRSGGQSKVPSVCHRHIQGALARLCCPRGHEWHPKIPDPQRWPLYRQTAFCSYVVRREKVLLFGYFAAEDLYASLVLSHGHIQTGTSVPWDWTQLTVVLDLSHCWAVNEFICLLDLSGLIASSYILQLWSPLSGPQLGLCDFPRWEKEENESCSNWENRHPLGFWSRTSYWLKKIHG